MLVLGIPQFHHSFLFWIWDFILFLVLLRLFLNKLAGFFKVSRNPISWIVSVLVETENDQSTGSCMPCHLSLFKVIKKHARKSLLYNNSESWIKKDSGLFDVTMGAYDGAEICELVGTFLLHKLSLKYNKNKIGLYRNDGLAIFKNISGPKSEKIKRIFKNCLRKIN